ncbi:MAG: electron transfer flavoprotein subunit alpha/FixB family protein [Acidimicrobiales bacterium]
MPAALNEIWVIVEQREGSVQSASREIVSAASRFADEVSVFVWGAGAQDCSADLGSLGATRVFLIEDDATRLTPRQIAEVIGNQQKSLGAPAAVLAPMSYDGRDISAHLSVMVDRPVISNVVGLELVDGALHSAHEILGGTRIARARVTDGGWGIFLIRAKSFAAAEGEARTPDVIRLAPPPLGDADRIEVLEHHVEERAGPRLDEAAIVVSGGRGLGDPDRYRLIEELAQLLGGAPAASRAIVDAGWVPYGYQVGQTGKTVKPEVYLAFGISGAMQHLVGMKGAKHIVAVNKDASAPIFRLVDLGIVGDVNVILPELIESVRRELTNG